jgi:uncharacterized protein
MTSDLPVIHIPVSNRFEVELPGEPAILVYSLRAGLMLLMHTEVPPEFEGRGIAGKLARAALEFARENNYKVRSFCAFTTRYIERHPEYQGLLG